MSTWKRGYNQHAGLNSRGNTQMSTRQSSIKYEKAIKNAKMVSYASAAIAVAALAVSVFILMHGGGKEITYINRTVYLNGTAPAASYGAAIAYNITSPLITPPMSLAADPPITANNTFGNRLTGINMPLNSTDLAVINNASDSNFETAGEMLINGKINNSVGISLKKVPVFMLNGKPTVIYLGSITCVFCGENRWAMALALSRFGNFSALFTGYSSFGDYNVPTIYWSPAHYNQSTMDLGSFYNSKYINFLAFEDTDPITAGFNLQTINVMQQEVNSTGNLAYKDAFQFIINLNNFQGTPYTIWGNYNAAGADAEDFGNSSPTATSGIQLEYMTHRQIFQQLSSPTDQFGWTEYAAADLYVAMICSSNSSINSTAPVCSLPAIISIEKDGY